MIRIFKGEKKQQTYTKNRNSKKKTTKKNICSKNPLETIWSLSSDVQYNVIYCAIHTLDCVFGYPCRWIFYFLTLRLVGNTKSPCSSLPQVKKQKQKTMPKNENPANKQTAQRSFSHQIIKIDSRLFLP